MKFHRTTPPQADSDFRALEGLRLCLDSLAEEAEALGRHMLALIIRAARDAVALEQGGR
jgi:hypothetical protein